MNKKYGEYESVNGGVVNGLMIDIEALEQEVREQKREIKRLTRENERFSR